MSKQISKNMKQLLLSAIIISGLSSPFVSQAASDIQFLSTENIIEMKGGCNSDVRIELYEGDNYELEPIYTATAPCNGDTFQISDDVLRWDIPEGTYKLVIDGERESVQNFLLKEPEMTMEETVNREAIANNLPSELSKSANDIFESAQASFGEKLYAMQTDFLTMQTALKDTTYPDFIKIGLGASLGLMGSTLEQLADTFFAVEQRDFVDTEATESSVVVTPAETEEEAAPEEVEEAIQIESTEQPVEEIVE
jgi:hypothetical protein